MHILIIFSSVILSIPCVVLLLDVLLMLSVERALYSFKRTERELLSKVSDLLTLHASKMCTDSISLRQLCIS